MTITKYTFFSPSGSEYPITSDADAKLYMMLSGVDYTTFKRKNWTPMTSVGLTRTYTNTSFVVAGRYFELKNHMITLTPATKNFVHVNIDLSTPLDPVSITVETADRSNTIDINNGCGVYRRCFETITTDSSGIVSSESIPQVNVFDNTQTNTVTADTVKVTNVTVDNKLTSKNIEVSGGITTYNLTVTNNIQTKTLTSTGAASVGTTLTAKTLQVNGSSKTNGNHTTTGTTSTKNLTVTPETFADSWAFATPTFYDTLTGTSGSLGYLTLFRSANVIHGAFSEDPTPSGIAGGGAIVGWITDNSFKPENTMYFTIWTTAGTMWRISIDSGGALRSHTPLPKGSVIWDSVDWIVRGTDKGVR